MDVGEAVVVASRCKIVGAAIGLECVVVALRTRAFVIVKTVDVKNMRL